VDKAEVEPLHAGNADDALRRAAHRQGIDDACPYRKSNPEILVMQAA
jgi:hypothetical protein